MQYDRIHLGTNIELIWRAQGNIYLWKMWIFGVPEDMIYHKVDVCKDCL